MALSKNVARGEAVQILLINCGWQLTPNHALNVKHPSAKAMVAIT
tara:strand:- start:71 stop:205 length:135 start_codon:yes stop_codon:yes gene_type:complete